MSCGVGPRRGLDLVLLWLWWRPAVTAPIQPLAWEPPCAVGAALKKPIRKKKKLKILDFSSTKGNLYKAVQNFSFRALMIIEPSSQTSLPQTFPSLWGTKCPCC